MPQNSSHDVMTQWSEPFPIVLRDEAIAIGQKWYFTGQPCPKGHRAKRNVSNRDCRACENERAARRRAENPEKQRFKDRAYYARTIEAQREKNNRCRKRHLRKRQAEDRKRYRKNPARYKRNAKKWRRLNKGKVNEITARRKSWIKRATPDTLSERHWRLIKLIYQIAAALPGDWHVDHIHPLRHERYCGLHVPWNLQIIPGIENIRKGNRFDPNQG